MVDRSMNPEEASLEASFRVYGDIFLPLSARRILTEHLFIKDKLALEWMNLKAWYPFGKCLPIAVTMKVSDFLLSI